MPAWPLLAILPPLALLTWWAIRGDRRTHLRRCPRCWYDMPAQGPPAEKRSSGLTCPECGHIAFSEAALHPTRRRRGVMRAGIAGLVFTSLLLVWSLHPSPWTLKLPRPAVRLLLDLFAPAPGPPGRLPTPDAAFISSNSDWERMVWQHQVARIMTEWADAVLATDGPITDAELARLAPLAEQVHALHNKLGATRASASWVEGRVKVPPGRRAHSRGGRSPPAPPP